MHGSTERRKYNRNVFLILIQHLSSYFAKGRLHGGAKGANREFEVKNVLN